MPSASAGLLVCLRADTSRGSARSSILTRRPQEGKVEAARLIAEPHRTNPAGPLRGKGDRILEPLSGHPDPGPRCWELRLGSTETHDSGEEVQAVGP